jgi:hypothetical protein
MMDDSLMHNSEIALQMHEILKKQLQCYKEWAEAAERVGCSERCKQPSRGSQCKVAEATQFHTSRRGQKDICLCEIETGLRVYCSKW